MQKQSGDILIGLVLLAAICSGQSVRGPRDSDDRKAIMRLSPIQEPETLDQLLNAPLIIDGNVISALAPRNTTKFSSTSRAPLIETHSVVAVTSVLKGTVPNSAATILISQVGGQAEGWELRVPDDPIMPQGERYVFFLVGDDDLRKDIVPNTSGMPRYAVFGIWAGKAKVVNGKIQFLPRASSRLHSLDSTDAVTFLQMIRDKLNNPVIPKSKLPIHPGGPLQP